MREIRRLSGAVMVLMIGAGGVAGAQTAEDKALAHLEKSRDALVAATEGLSEAQWTFRESEERWSAAEIVAHLALSEDFFFEMISGKVLQTQKRPAPLPNAEEADEEVLALLTDRSQRFDAPEPLEPTDRFETPAAAMDQFLASRARTIALLNDTPDLRLHVMAAPGGAERDALQWLLFVSGHTVRHTAQLKEVKAAAGFPEG